MKPITLITLLTLAMQGGHMGSRVVASLLALNLGAGPMLIGVLIAAYSIFQLAFALVVGRISDRYGSRRPMLGGAIAFGCGLIIPAVSPTLPALFISAPLIGIGFVFFNVAAQNLAGTLGNAEERTRNFSTMSLGYSSGHMIGPVLAGIMIDRHGFGAAGVIR
ncbi:MAG: MFS transporter, partial [Burkholderiales bacterium]